MTYFIRRECLEPKLQLVDGRSSKDINKRLLKGLELTDVEGQNLCKMTLHWWGGISWEIMCLIEMLLLFCFLTLKSRN